MFLHGSWLSVTATIFKWSDQSEVTQIPGDKEHHVVDEGVGEWQDHIIEGPVAWEKFSWPFLKIQSTFSLPFCPPAVLALFSCHRCMMFLVCPRFTIFANTVTPAWIAFLPDPFLVKFDLHYKF